MLFFGAARAQDPDSIANAQTAAKSWLALTDVGEYSTSWEQAAGLFQTAVSKASWQSAVQAARSPLGSLKSRTLKSAKFVRSLPAFTAPVGVFVGMPLRQVCAVAFQLGLRGVQTYDDRPPEEDTFPFRSQDPNREGDLEEERRLAYVAITRARHKLTLRIIERSPCHPSASPESSRSSGFARPTARGPIGTPP